MNQWWESRDNDTDHRGERALETKKSKNTQVQHSGHGSTNSVPRILVEWIVSLPLHYPTLLGFKKELKQQKKTHFTHCILPSHNIENQTL